MLLNTKNGECMKISFGSMDLLESETFLTVPDEVTRIEVGQDDDTVGISLEFADKEGADQNLAMNSSDNKTLEIKLINWSNSLGTGLVEPIHIGQFRNRLLYFNIFVVRAGKAPVRKVTFSLYLGQEVSRGAN